MEINTRDSTERLEKKVLKGRWMNRRPGAVSFAVARHEHRDPSFTPTGRGGGEGPACGAVLQLQRRLVRELDLDAARVGKDALPVQGLGAGRCGGVRRPM